MARKVFVGADRLQAAQEASGLSNEALGRRLQVSERTWRRWKEDGWVPNAHLPAVAAQLQLEPSSFLTPAEGELSLEEVQKLRGLLEEFQVYFEDLSRRVDALQRPPARESQPKKSSASEDS